MKKVCWILTKGQLFTTETGVFLQDMTSDVKSGVKFETIQYNQKNTKSYFSNFSLSFCRWYSQRRQTLLVRSVLLWSCTTQKVDKMLILPRSLCGKQVALVEEEEEGSKLTVSHNSYMYMYIFELVGWLHTCTLYM